MSYYIDPWLYNCSANPADSPTQQMEQRTIVEATNRALDYAHKHGVTLIALRGQRAHGHRATRRPTASAPTIRRGRPTTGTSTTRASIVPTEGHHVISVGATGPIDDQGGLLELGHRADPGHRAGRLLPRRLRHAEAPHQREPGALGVPAGARGRQRPAEPGRLAEHGDRRPRLPGAAPAAYYQYLQGTSMASPHAVGVAALIISQWGHPDRGKKSGQLKMKPKERGEDPRADGHGSCVPGPADDRLHDRRPDGGVQRDVHRHDRVQLDLGRRHRRRPRRGQRQEVARTQRPGPATAQARARVALGIA